MVRPVLLCLGLVACADDSVGDGVFGTRGDVATTPGNYAGYRVETTCATSFPDIGVIGTGGHTVTETTEIASFGQTLYASLGDIRSVWGGAGVALACTSGVGTSVYLDDWRDVDAIIERAGAFLRDNDLALEVGISVEGIPVPVAD